MNGQSHLVGGKAGEGSEAGRRQEGEEVAVEEFFKESLRV